MASSNPLEVARKAAQGFVLFQCVKCAKAIRKALKAEGHHGEWIVLKPKGKREFMVCITYDENTSITQTGIHVGIRVAGKVFDNLHANGLAYEDWVKDFDAHGGVRILSVDPF